MVFVEFQSLVDWPGMYFAGELFSAGFATCCGTPPLFGKDIAISNFLFSFRDEDGGDGLGSR